MWGYGLDYLIYLVLDNQLSPTTGTKIHVAVDCNSLPVSIIIGSANEHDSTRLIDVMENISDYLDDNSIKQITSVYADKGYDSKAIREFSFG